MYRYYSTQRPIVPGSYPNKAKANKIENFDDRVFCDDINMPAWGYIEYDEPLDKAEQNAYELVNKFDEYEYKILYLDEGKKRVETMIARTQADALATFNRIYDDCTVKDIRKQRIMMSDNERLFARFALGDEEMAITKRGDEWLVHHCFDESTGKGAAMKRFCTVFDAWNYIWMLAQTNNVQLTF